MTDGLILMSLIPDAPGLKIQAEYGSDECDDAVDNDGDNLVDNLDVTGCLTPIDDESATWYVSFAGNDSTGLSWVNAFNTIGPGAFRVNQRGPDFRPVRYPYKPDGRKAFGYETKRLICMAGLPEQKQACLNAHYRLLTRLSFTVNVLIIMWLKEPPMLYWMDSILPNHLPSRILPAE